MFIFLVSCLLAELPMMFNEVNLNSTIATSARLWRAREWGQGLGSGLPNIKNNVSVNLDLLIKQCKTTKIGTPYVLYNS
jgi:hypothetical protein